MAGNTGAPLNLYLPGGGSSGLYDPDETLDVDRINENFQDVNTWAGTTDTRLDAREDGGVDFLGRLQGGNLDFVNLVNFSNYYAYRLFLKATNSAGANRTIGLQVGTGSTWVTSATYRHLAISATVASPVASAGATSGTRVDFATLADGNIASVEALIWHDDNTTFPQLTFDGVARISGSVSKFNGGGYSSDATANGATSFRVLASSTGVAFDGRLYGLRRDA